MNKRIYLFWASLIFLSSSLYAQVNRKPATVPPLKAQHNIFVNTVSRSVSLLALGYSYEHPLTDKLIMAISPDIGFREYSSLFNIVSFNAGVMVQGRYYYNRLKRMQNEKSLSLNTGHFFGASLSFDYIFSNYDVFSTPYFVIPTAFWGLRSNLGRKFFFDMTLGLGLHYTTKRFPVINILGGSNVFANNLNIRPTITIQFAYTLNSIKK